MVDANMNNIAKNNGDCSSKSTISFQKRKKQSVISSEEGGILLHQHGGKRREPLDMYEEIDKHGSLYAVNKNTLKNEVQEAAGQLPKSAIQQSRMSASEIKTTERATFSTSPV